MTTLNIPGIVLFIGAVTCGWFIAGSVYWDIRDALQLRQQYDAWCTRGMIQVYSTIAFELASLAFLVWVAIWTLQAHMG
jgi:hypothetical protein